MSGRRQDLWQQFEHSLTGRQARITLYSPADQSLAELQQRYLEIARRTLQRYTQKWLQDDYITAYGQGRGRRYLSLPDPTTHRDRPVIKRVVKEVVLRLAEPALQVIDAALAEEVESIDRTDVRSLIIEDLSVLDEGRLVRYGLRPSELAQWKASVAIVERQGNRLHGLTPSPFSLLSSQSSAATSTNDSPDAKVSEEVIISVSKMSANLRQNSIPDRLRTIIDAGHGP